MTEEETAFDASLKKKKKKKKTPFDLEGALNEGGEDAPETKDDDGAGEDIDLENFGKKKKKKKTVKLEEDEDEAEDGGDDLDLESFGKKKKKKKRGGADDLDAAMDENKENENDEDTTAWGGSDRDYTYDELLQRVYNIMKEKNPESVIGETKKFVMRPPQVVKVGTKKTAFVNFTEIAKMLHRQPKHLLAFLFAELGTTGAIDGNSQLVMKGKFQQKHIENVLRRYIKEYVTCHTCRSPDTILNKETRLFFLQCMKCHSKCSVQTIKTGFQAVTGSRKAARNKQ